MSVNFGAHHFRTEREADWARLEELLDKLEQSPPPASPTPT